MNSGGICGINNNNSLLHCRYYESNKIKQIKYIYKKTRKEKNNRGRNCIKVEVECKMRGTVVSCCELNHLKILKTNPNSG